MTFRWLCTHTHAHSHTHTHTNTHTHVLVYASTREGARTCTHTHTHKHTHIHDFSKPECFPQVHDFFCVQNLHEPYRMQVTVHHQPTRLKDQVTAYSPTASQNLQWICFNLYRTTLIQRNDISWSHTHKQGDFKPKHDKYTKPCIRIFKAVLTKRMLFSNFYFTK